MRKRLPTLALLLWAAAAAAQTDYKNSVQVYFSPAVSYRFLIDQGHTFSSGFIIQDRNAREVPGFGFSAGVDYERRILPWFSVSAGIQYQYHSYRIPHFPLLVSAGDTIGDVTYDYIYHFINLPVGFRFYYLRRPKWEMYGYLGVVAKFSVEALVHYYGRLYGEDFDHTYSLPDPSLDDMQRNIVQCDILLGNGFHYQFSPRFSANAELYFGLDPVYSFTSSPIRELLWRAGGTVGFHTHF